MIENYINHLCYLIDCSGSMQSLTNTLVTVFDNQIKHLLKRSSETGQQTRISIYLFSDKVECLVYDTDVSRIPSLKSYYKAGGQTALLDAVLTGVSDLRKTPEIHANHSFLIYLLTDSENNVNDHLAPKVASVVSNLPDNYTIAIFVPDPSSAHEAKKLGFSPNNIALWTTDKKGTEEVGHVMQEATETYMRARATGVRSTRSLFDINAQNLSTTNVKSALQELVADRDYEVLLVRNSKDKIVIKPFVEGWTKNPYRVGSAYYQLSKPETVQASKNICVMDRRNGKLYSGDNARSLLGLPSYEVKVDAANFSGYDIFIQSTSTNRLLVPGTKVILLK